MPTPVSVARQCLTDEAARALDDAVSVARRRCHAQTTSFHAVSALLALPSSTLREACARARSSAYSPRLQFRALELSVGVSLDRLPSSKTIDEPPVSNSLMAAIKRSQANQRRQPESFHLHQIIHQQQQQQTTSLFKVELKQFILSILDDPNVSRVFGEAGFRSCDLKFSIIHPPVTVSSSRLSKTRCPPIFLCNLTDSDLDQKGLSFPFTGGDDGDENCRRIGKILVRKSSKNPLLIGVCANDALNCFAESVQKGKGGVVLPSEIDGLCVISIENEVSEFVGNGGNKESMDLKFKELGDMVKNCSGPGIVANFGDLKLMVDDGVSGHDLSYLVSQFSGLLELYRDKLWLMGAAGSYESYMKLLARFPSIEKDLDLHLLPITSSRPSSCSKSSLMGSFVPFGGFFSTSSDFKLSLTGNNEFKSRCKLCNTKYEEEVSSLKSGCNVSVGDQFTSTIPSWLQMTELDPSRGVDATKAKDDGAVLNAKIVGLQKKWDDICQRLHHALQFPKPDISQARTHFLSTEGCQSAEDKKENGSKDSSPSQSGSASSCPYMHMDLNSPQKQNERIPVASKAENANFQFKLPLDVSERQQLGTGSSRSSLYHLPNLSRPPDRVSLPSVTSVTTDLSLGTLYASNSHELNQPRCEDHEERLQNLPTSVSAKLDVANENIMNHIAKPSSCSDPDIKGQLDPRDFKSVWRVLLEKVGWQDEAICTISQTVSLFKTGKRKHRGSLRGDIWLSFLGPDKVGKKKIALALAEVVFGSRESLISLDFSSSHDGIDQSNSIFDSQELDGHVAKFRGKTVVDYIADELRNRPRSVVFLENIDKADLLAQSSLSQAIRTGRFPDSHGREIGINNMIFVTTSCITKDSQCFIPHKEHTGLSEEVILEAKRWQMKILIRNVAGDSSSRGANNVFVAPPKEISSFENVNKRKLSDTSDCNVASDISERPQKVSRSYLDLNLPLAELEDDNEYGKCDSGSISENSEAWLEDFLDQVDEKVVLKPFDFDSLADKVMKEISLYFQKTFRSEILLDIDNLVMLQIVAAAWLSDNKRAVEDWVQQVLGKSFVEVQQRHCLGAQSVVKLVACEGLVMEEQAPGVCLPARIILS